MKTTRSVTASPRRRPWVAGLIAGCLLALSAGCNKGPAKPDNIPDLTPCTVTVTYKGQPVPDASVVLAPTSGTLSAAAMTDAAGKAVLKTDGLYDGVPAGEYRVSVTKMEKVDAAIGGTPENPEEMAAYQEKLKNMPAPKHLLPEKYSNFTTSGLTVTIAEGSPVEQTFELTD